MEFKDVKKFAQSKGGKCLSKEPDFLLKTTLLKFSCAKGHKWETQARNTMRGYWCRICSRTLNITAKEFNKLIESKGGKCLTKLKEPLKSEMPIKLACQHGHKWKSQVRSPLNGHWCISCHNLDYDLFEKAKKKATTKYGECLSEKYKGANKLHKWECKNGHKWKATPNNIMKEKWCPKCLQASKTESKHVKNIKK